MRLRTKEELLQALDEEWIWRFRELVALRSLVFGSEHIRRNTYIRADIALLYAHTEGYFKRAADIYLKYVRRRRIAAAELSDGIYTVQAYRKVKELRESLHIGRVSDIVVSIRNDERLGSIRKNDNVDVRANIDSCLFFTYTGLLGIETPLRTTKNEKTIDRLRDHRNRIAHGDMIEITVDGWVELHDEVVELLRQFKDGIVDSADRNRYRRRTQ